MKIMHGENKYVIYECLILNYFMKTMNGKINMKNVNVYWKLINWKFNKLTVVHLPFFLNLKQEAAIINNIINLTQR